MIAIHMSAAVPRICRQLSALLLVAASSNAAFGALVYDTAAPLTGNRAVGSGLTNSGDADWNDVTVDWLVTNNGNGTFTYKYTLTNFDRPGISHFNVDLSDNALNDPNVVTGATMNGNPIAGGDIEIGNHDGLTGDVKFDVGVDGTVIYEFTSNRSPVFGNIAVKGGQLLISNTGLGQEGTSMNPIDFVARPDTVIPEPTSLVLAAGALGFLLNRTRTARRLAVR